MTAAPLPWQVENIRDMATKIAQHGVVLDTSDGGAGKTWMTAFTAKRINRRLTVIAPKRLHVMWREVCAAVGVELDFVVNVEKLVASKWKPKDGGELPVGYWKIHKRNWEWFIRRGSVLVFDEVHGFGGYRSQSSRILVAAKRQNLPTIMLSATVADNPLKLRAIGYRLGICPFEWNAWQGWLLGIGVTYDFFGALQWPHKASTKPIVDAMKPYRTGINTANVPDYPKNRIFGCIVETSKKVDVAFKKAIEALEALRVVSEFDCVDALRARQMAEIQKVSWCIEDARNAEEEGFSVFITPTFRKTAELIAERLNVPAITSETDTQKCQELIAEFQSNRLRFFIGTQSSVSEGISLHDLHGRPRQSIIFPNFDSLKFVQATKRTHRAGGQSSVIQKIPFLDNQVETRMREKIERKLSNLSEITDNDFSFI